MEKRESKAKRKEEEKGKKNILCTHEIEYEYVQWMLLYYCNKIYHNNTIVSVI